MTLFQSKRGVKWAGVALGVLGLAFIFSRILQPGYDFYGLFYPAIRLVWQGQFLYAALPLFTNPPWTLLLLLPLGLFNVELARAFLVVATLIVIAWVMCDYRRFKFSFPLAIGSLPLLALVWVGQLEIFSLAGTLLAYRAIGRRSWPLMAIGLLLLTIKPQETFVIVLLLISGSMRRWSLVEWVKIAAASIGTAAITSLLFGFGWLDRIFDGPAYASGWQNFSLWQLSQSVPRVIVIGLWLLIAIGTVWALRRAGVSRLGLGLAAIASNLLSPYLTSPHLLMTVSFGWGQLFDQSPRWAFVIYLTSLTPLLRLSSGDQSLNRLDLIFPISVFLSLVILQHKNRFAHRYLDSS